MKVYRKVVLNIQTGHVVKEDFYEYGGPIIEAKGGGGGTTTTTNVPDPTAQALNRQFGAQRNAVVAATGGFAPFAEFNPLALPSQRELGLLGEIGSFANRPAIDPFQQEGLSLLLGATNPALREAAARETLSNIIAPTIVNELTKAGQGRSGAVGETIANAGASLALPIALDTARAQQQTGAGLLAFGPEVEQREMSRLRQALGAAETPRLLEFQEIQRPLQILSSLFSPGFIPAGSSSGTISTTQAGGK